MNREHGRNRHLPETASPDQVEEASLGSFPASDPPSWIAVHAGRPATPATQGSSSEPGSPEADANADSPAAKDPTD